MPDLVPWLIAILLFALIAFLYWADRRYPGRLTPRERTHYLTYCAWCTRRDGDLCTHLGSPVYPDECGPVCIGQVKCRVRQATP